MIQIQNAGFKIDGKTILNDLSFILPEGESMAIVGPSGCGKTTLGRLISGRTGLTSGRIQFANGKLCLMVEQQDSFMAASHMRSGYYSQRFENQEMDGVPTVRAYLQIIAKSFKTEASQSTIDKHLQRFDMLAISDRKLMQLSDGERKRLQLIAALLQNPDILVLDQPFVGLDILSRKKLEEHLVQFQESGKTVVLICDPEHIPEHIDWVLEMGNGCTPKMNPRKLFGPVKSAKPELLEMDQFFVLLQPSVQEQFEYAVRMKNVNVHLNGNKILKNINWEVRKGERWALLGPNGSGKTTLLSLITADNPQGYCNDLTLFDRQRGSGETIWNIKKRIGFVSPELHLFFLGGKGIFNSIPGLENSQDFIGDPISCENVVSSGFHDQIGFSDSKSEIQKKAVSDWLSIFQLNYLSGKSFHEVSLSEQRLLLLARAMVKMPSLLVLDEPCQGLEPHQTRRFTEMLDFVCSKLETTLIYVTHHSEEIPKSVNRLLQLDKGNVMYCGKFPASGKY